MTGEILLGIKIIANQGQYLKIDVNLEEKVVTLKDEAAKIANVNPQDIECFYRGLPLKDDFSLSSYNITTGELVHVLKKKKEAKPTPPRKYSESDIQQLVVAFKTFTHTTGYRSALHRLSRPEVLENIIAATPGLAQDAVAQAIITDPELIVQLSDIDTVRRAAEDHPSLLEAAHHIAAHFHEEASNVNQNQPSTSTGYSYSLDAISDEEAMDSPSSEDSPRTSAPLQRNASYNAITAAQLAAAISNATNYSFDSQMSSAAAPPSTTPTNSNSMITSEMFSNAMQQAFASSPAFGSSSPPVFPTVNSNDSTEVESFDDVIERWEPQISQMHEMGLKNDVVNVRALQTTSGDVQAAIELVLSGAFE